MTNQTQTTKIEKAARSFFVVGNIVMFMDLVVNALLAIL